MNPDVVTYTTFLNILARSKDANKVIIADAILEKMEGQSKENPNMMPNNFTYDAILRTCAHPSTFDKQTLRRALILGVRTMSKFQESKSFQPTSYTFNLFFSVLNRLSSGEEKKKLFIQSFSDCCKQGLLDGKTFESLKRNTDESLLQMLFDTDSMDKLEFSDLPDSWKCNIRTKSVASASSLRFSERVVDNTGRRKLRQR